MRHLARITIIAAVVMAAGTACGGSPTSPTSPRPQAVFPLTISRTGGIAGFRDVLVVSQDGRVSVTRRGQKTRECQLTPAMLTRLTTAASQVPWTRVTPAGTSPSHPDDMVSTIQSPLSPPVRLEDPRTGSGRQVFSELLASLTSGPAGARVCRPA